MAKLACNSLQYRLLPVTFAVVSLPRLASWVSSNVNYDINCYVLYAVVPTIILIALVCPSVLYGLLTRKLNDVAEKNQNLHEPSSDVPIFSSYGGVVCVQVGLSDSRGPGRFSRAW